MNADARSWRGRGFKVKDLHGASASLPRRRGRHRLDNGYLLEESEDWIRPFMDVLSQNLAENVLRNDGKYIAQTARAYEGLASECEERAAGKMPFIKDLVAGFAPQIRTGRAVLDVGCGIGLAACAFVERGFSVMGIDVSAKMLSSARRRCPKQRSSNRTFSIFKQKDRWTASSPTPSYICSLRSMRTWRCGKCMPCLGRMALSLSAPISARRVGKASSRSRTIKGGSKGSSGTGREWSWNSWLPNQVSGLIDLLSFPTTTEISNG